MFEIFQEENKYKSQNIEDGVYLYFVFSKSLYIWKFCLGSIERNSGNSKYYESPENMEHMAIPKLISDTPLLLRYSVNRWTATRREPFLLCESQILGVRNSKYTA